MPKNVPSYRQRIGSDQVLVTLMDAMTKQRLDYWLGVHGMLGWRFSLAGTDHTACLSGRSHPW